MGHQKSRDELRYARSRSQQARINNLWDRLYTHFRPASIPGALASAPIDELATALNVAQTEPSPVPSA